MADENLELAVKVRADIRQALREMKQLRQGVAGVGEAGERAGRKTGVLFRELDLGNGILGRNVRLARNASVAIGAIGTAAAGAIGAQAVSSFASLEEGLVAVRKTADLTDQEMATLESRVQELATTIPASTDELLRNAEAAGQLGVQGVDDILAYSETIAKLGRTTDVSGQQAAKSIARILNVTGEGNDRVDEFGSVLVRLGNSAAGSESEILRITNEVARATSEFEVASHEAAAVGAAMVDMGIRAELGGTSYGKAMRAIREATQEGGDQLRELQELTGLTFEQIREQLENNPARLMVRWFRGIKESGEPATQVLDRFGLKGEEVAKSLPALIQNVAGLETHLKNAGEEARDAGALQAEFEKAVGTLQSELDLLASTFGVASEKVGEELAPHIREASEDLRAFLNNDQAVERFADALGSVVDGFVEATKVATDFYNVATGQDPVRDIRLPEVQNPEQAERLVTRLREQRANVRDELSKTKRMLELQWAELVDAAGGEDRAQVAMEGNLVGLLPGAQGQVQDQVDRVAALRTKLAGLKTDREDLNRLVGAAEDRQEELARAQKAEAEATQESADAHGEQAARIQEAGASAEDFREFVDQATQQVLEDSRKQAEAWQRVAERIKDQADPMRSIRREMRLTRTLMDEGLISDDLGMARLMQLEEQLGEVGRAAEDSKEDAKEAFGGMSEFAIQARRNIQSQLADTLVDTMQGSFDSILEGWVRMIQRMVAEAAAAQIMESLTGEGTEGEGVLGSIPWGQIFSGGGGASGAQGHTGGVVGRNLTPRTVNPAWYADAPHYQTGGIAGLKADEVPAVLHRGEEVLTKEDPRHRANGGMGSGPVTVNQSFPNAQSGEEVRQSAAQGGKAAARAVQRAKERNL